MTLLENKKILYLGSGNMGQEGIKSLFAEENHVNPADVTIICGKSAGKDKKAVQSILTKVGIDVNEVTLLDYDEVEKHLSAIEPHYDIAVAAIKPHKVKAAFAPFSDKIDENTHLISMVAGLDEAILQQLTKSTAKVAQAMPHMPKALYGLYSSHEDSLELTKLLYRNMGKPLQQQRSEQMSGFTSVCGSAPGVIACFISKFKTKKDQQRAMEWLEAFSSGRTITDSSGLKNMDIGDLCLEFYNGYLAVSKDFLGEEHGPKVVKKCLQLTIDDMRQSELNAKQYAASIRSARGTTNAAMMVMGSAPPQTPKFGTTEQLLAQNDFTQNFADKSLYCKEDLVEAHKEYRHIVKKPSPEVRNLEHHKIDIATSTIASFIAARDRCAKLAEALMDPMHNLNPFAIEVEVNKIAQTLKKNSNGHGY